MALVYRVFLVSLLLAGTVVALPSWFTLSQYTPSTAQCPMGNLIRPAYDLSADESAWTSRRRIQTSGALRSWIAGFNINRTTSDTFLTIQLPVVALASSGGGLRSALLGAGVVQMMDARETLGNTSNLGGLYQSLTYHTGECSHPVIRSLMSDVIQSRLLRISIKGRLESDILACYFLRQIYFSHFVLASRGERR